MALLKLNVLHLHLVDNEGWRIEIKKYPKLTEVGAWRVDQEDKLWDERVPNDADAIAKGAKKYGEVRFIKRDYNCARNRDACTRDECYCGLPRTFVPQTPYWGAFRGCVAYYRYLLCRSGGDF